MSTVFKYCDAHGINILTNLELKVTPPNQFNDPFEFAAHTVCSDPVRWAHQHLNKERIRELYNSAVLAGSFGGNLRDFRKWFKGSRNDLIERWILPRINQALIHTQEKVLDDISESIGVLCLSDKEDSIVMWGHYCDKHRGMIVGFDAANSVFQRGFALRSVAYESARITLDLALTLSPKDRDQLNERIMFTKNEEWRYERELRQLFHLHSMRQSKLPDGKIGFFCSIPPQAIVSVYLGVKCSATLEAQVRDALTPPHLSHVRLSRVRLHESEFRLDCG